MFCFILTAGFPISTEGCLPRNVVARRQLPSLQCCHPTTASFPPMLSSRPRASFPPMLSPDDTSRRPNVVIPTEGFSPSGGTCCSAASRPSSLILRRFRQTKSLHHALLPRRFELRRRHPLQNLAARHFHLVAHRLAHNAAEVRRAWNLRQDRHRRRVFHPINRRQVVIGIALKIAASCRIQIQRLAWRI